ncbi:type II secretion system F family protein [Anatilimnocola sp. NA78]|uniref:type II secretion system F family protein n=1 Tax=Anatilimnocola sp. NA78 TaxID=3415683 RepID=UPI003CE4CD7F
MEQLGPLALSILLVPGVALLMALRLFYRRQMVTSSNQARLALSLAAWILIYLGIFGAGIGSFAVLSVVYGPILIVSILMLIDRFRRSEHHALLNALAFATERGIPLAETARAYAQEHAGDTGVRALYLAERLEAGATLAEATRQARLRLNTPMRLAVNLSDLSALRGLTLRSQLQWGSDSDSAFRTVINRLIYICALFLVLQTILTFLMLKIVPVFQKMFEEFGIQLPVMTESLIDVARWSVRGGWMLMVPFMLLGAAGTMIGVLFYSGFYAFPVAPQKSLRTQAASAPKPDVMRFMDFLYSFRFLFWRYDSSLVLRSLSLLLKQHHPLPEALMILANVYPRPNVRRRLTRAALEVSEGRDWKQALRNQWLLGKSEAAVLEAAVRAGNLPWAMDEMGESLMRRLTYRMMVIYQFVYPTLLLSFGAFVAFVCIALMLPLIALIQGLT